MTTPSNNLPSAVQTIILTLVLVAGCGGGGSQRPSVDTYYERWVHLSSTLVNSNSSRRSLSGQAPLVAYFAIGQQPNWNSPNYPNDPAAHLDQFTKAELDFGDGQGWQDVTADARTKWWQQPLGTPTYYQTNYMTPHTYTEPGVYEVNGRITWWDGQVMEAGPGWRVTVTVTAAASSGT